MPKKNTLDGCFNLDSKCRQVADITRECMEADRETITRLVCGTEVFFALSLFGREGRFEGVPFEVCEDMPVWQLSIERGEE